MKIEIEYDNEILTLIDNQLLVTFIIQSFRYCLGRRSYAVSDCVKILQQYWNKLPGFLQRQIQNDIREALKLDHAGDQCDQFQWSKILKLVLKPQDNH